MASTQNLFIDQLTLSTEYGERSTNAQEVVTSATIAINTDNYGSVHVSAQHVAVTFSTVGTQTTDLQPLLVRILDDGSARAITWDASFEAVGAALPTTTVAGKRHTVGFRYDAVTGKFGCISAVVES